MLTAKDRMTLRFLVTPQDIAANGTTVQAGRLLEWIDSAGYACAVGWSGSYCVTAFVGDVHFGRPVLPNSLVEVNARIVHTGRSSMHILVSVETADVRDRSFGSATHCLIIMVAVDDTGAPTAVPEWEPWSDGDRTLQHRAIERVGQRDEIRAAMEHAVYSDAGTAPRTVFRFLASPADRNWDDTVHGGTVMRWIDEAAYACAASWSSPNAVAVYAGGIQFRNPIRVGDIVEVDARLVHTGERSMHIGVRVRSGPADRTSEFVQTTQCMSVFVDVGSSGHAVSVAELPLITEEDRHLDAHARRLIELRSHLAKMPPGLAAS